MFLPSLTRAERDPIMRHLPALAIAAAFAFGAPAAAHHPGGYGPLVAAAELYDDHDDAALLIVDIRAAVPAYAGGHIPGAVSAPYALFRGPAGNPGELPTEARLTELLRSLGATKDRPVVIVHQGTDETDFGAAARVYWTLKSSGVSTLAILNGGMNAWVAGGYDVSRDAAVPIRSDIDVRFSHQWLATTEDVAAIVDGTADGALLDARPEAFWKGNRAHPAAGRAGTLPQSQYFTHSSWFASGPAIIDAAAARDLAVAQGFSADDRIVSFCNTGHWAATNWFALSELAGIDGVRLYPDSMVGWSMTEGPMLNTPGIARSTWNQIAAMF
ncbi:MAG: thiosulfate/3-mercaptopyruvate sulfurtransferase [Paracoccaceae bacterium]|jgi:thiosulfate/3-mercaptopyruvate sulfurtransferase